MGKTHRNHIKLHYVQGDVCNIKGNYKADSFTNFHDIVVTIHSEMRYSCYLHGGDNKYGRTKLLSMCTNEKCHNCKVNSDIVMFLDCSGTLPPNYNCDWCQEYFTEVTFVERVADTPRGPTLRKDQYCLSCESDLNL